MQADAHVAAALAAAASLGNTSMASQASPRDDSELSQLSGHPSVDPGRNNLKQAAIRQCQLPSQILQWPHLEPLDQGAVAWRVLCQPSARPHIIAQPILGRLRATRAS